MLRWVLWVIVALVVTALVTSSLTGGGTSKADLTYSQFVAAVDDGKVKSIEFNTDTGAITGVYVKAQGGKSEFASTGPKNDLPNAELAALKDKGVDIK